MFRLFLVALLLVLVTPSEGYDLALPLSLLLVAVLARRRGQR